MSPGLSFIGAAGKGILSISGSAKTELRNGESDGLWGRRKLKRQDKVALCGHHPRTFVPCHIVDYRSFLQKRTMAHKKDWTSCWSRLHGFDFHLRTMGTAWVASD
jgi:hypothetical protein